MSEQDKEELARAIVELIRTNHNVRCALWDSVCSCPNIVIQY